MKRSLGQFGSMTIDVNVGYLLAFAGLDPNPIYLPAATRARVRTTQNSSYITPSLCSGFGISLGHRLHFRRARGPHALAGGEQCKVVPVLEFDLNADLAHARRIASPHTCDKTSGLLTRCTGNRVKSCQLVQHAIIANTQLILEPPCQAAVGEAPQPCAHLIHLALHGVANLGQKCVEGSGERW